MRRTSLRSIRRVRLAAAIGAAALATALYATRMREVGVRTWDGWMLSVGSGCLQTGYNPGRFRSAPTGGSGGPYVMRSWHTDWTFAWRPFRVATGDNNILVVPLWHGAMALAGISVWASGLLAGVRRARTTACLCCGYDLALVPATDGARRCPECGAVPMDVG